MEQLASSNEPQNDLLKSIKDWFKKPKKILTIGGIAALVGIIFSLANFFNIKTIDDIINNTNPNKSKGTHAEDTVGIVNTQLADSIFLDNSKYLESEFLDSIMYDSLVFNQLTELLKPIPLSEVFWKYNGEDYPTYLGDPKNYPSVMDHLECYLHLLEILDHQNPSFKVIDQIKASDRSRCKFTIVNKTESLQVISQVQLFIISVSPWRAGGSASKIIKSMAEISIVLPLKSGRYQFNLAEPIQIISGDAISLEVLYSLKDESDFGESEYFYVYGGVEFILSTIFISDENLYVMSNFSKIGGVNDEY